MPQLKIPCATTKTWAQPNKYVHINVFFFFNSHLTEHLVLYMATLSDSPFLLRNPDITNPKIFSTVLLLTLFLLSVPRATHFTLSVPLDEALS